MQSEKWIGQDAVDPEGGQGRAESSHEHGVVLGSSNNKTADSSTFASEHVRASRDIGETSRGGGGICRLVCWDGELRLVRYRAFRARCGNGGGHEVVGCAFDQTVDLGDRCVWNSERYLITAAAGPVIDFVSDDAVRRARSPCEGDRAGACSVKAVANRAKARHTRFKADVNIGIMVSIYNAVNISSERARLFHCRPAPTSCFHL